MIYIVISSVSMIRDILMEGPGPFIATIACGATRNNQTIHGFLLSTFSIETSSRSPS